jgi:hypothetical protein
LSQCSGWIDPYLLFHYVILFTLDKLYKSECTHCNLTPPVASSDLQLFWEIFV